MSACCENHDGAHLHGCTRPRQSNGAEHSGGCLIRRECRHADSLYGRCMDCGMTWEDQAAELASHQRMIGQGVDPGPCSCRWTGPDDYDGPDDHAVAAERCPVHGSGDPS